MLEEIEQTRRGEDHFGRLELRQERYVCSIATNKPVSERVKHATGICRRRAASEALKKIGLYKHSAPTEPRRRVRKASQLRRERDVCSMATNRSISERVKHATEVCRRQAASKRFKKIGEQRRCSTPSGSGIMSGRILGLRPVGLTLGDILCPLRGLRRNAPRHFRLFRAFRAFRGRGLSLSPH